MEITEASDFLESLRNKTDKRSEIKIYENFVEILSALKGKNLTEEQIQSIEKELDKLELKANPENRKKYFKQRLSKLKTFLKDNFSLITTGYYAIMGASYGILLGVLLEASFGMVFQRSLGICLGLIIGFFVGQYMDKAAEKQNRVLRTKVNYF